MTATTQPPQVTHGFSVIPEAQWWMAEVTLAQLDKPTPNFIWKRKGPEWKDLPREEPGVRYCRPSRQIHSHDHDHVVFSPESNERTSQQDRAL